MSAKCANCREPIFYEAGNGWGHDPDFGFRFCFKGDGVAEPEAAREIRRHDV